MGRDARDQACQSNKLIQIDVLLVCAENNRTCIYHDYAFIGRIRIETAGQSRLPDQRTMNANMLFRSLLLTVLNFDFYKNMNYFVRYIEIGKKIDDLQMFFYSRSAFFKGTKRMAFFFNNLVILQYMQLISFLYPTKQQYELRCCCCFHTGTSI